VAVIAVAAALFTPHTVRSSAGAVPSKFALLVGVNEYKKGSGIKNLSGAHNDVRLMKSLLSELGFIEDAVAGANASLFPCGAQKEASALKTLCSAQATKAAILAAFDTQLIKNAKNYWKGAPPEPVRGPMVVFYYSGHGSQLPDDQPVQGEKASELLIDESDGLDETLVPHDTDEAGTRDIRDDSFKTRIDILKTYTTNIVFMADSCHSGTISRGSEARNVPRRFKDETPVTRGAEDSEMPADNNYVTISGSLPTQLSYEDELPDPIAKKPVRNGFLTYYFVQAVRQNPGATYREVIGLVRNNLAAAGKAQTPQVEGDIDRPVFGAAGTQAKRAIGIKCSGSVCTRSKNDGRGASRTRTVSLDAGQVVGARPGGPIAVYAPGSLDLTGSTSRIALGTIVSAEPFSSEAEIEFTDAKMADLPPLSKAVLISPSFSDTKRRVAIDVKGASATDPGAAAVKKLAQHLNENSAFYEPLEVNDVLRSLASGQHDWELAIVRSTYHSFKAGMYKGAGPAEAGPDDHEGYYIADQGGAPLYDLWIKTEDAAAADKLEDALEKHAKVVNIRALNNQVSNLTGKVKVEQVRYKSAARQGSTCVSVPFTPVERSSMVAGDAPRIKRSEAFDIKITNRSENRLYFYVYSIDSAGAIGLIFPVRGANEQIAAGQTYLTSQGNPCWLLTFAPNSPTGFETVKVLVSEKPVQADLLISTGIRGRGADSFLDKLLRQAGSNTRSDRLSAVNEIDDWAAFSIDYTVVP
jgi:hypothetical protein